MHLAENVTLDLPDGRRVRLGDVLAGLMVRQHLQEREIAVMAATIAGLTASQAAAAVAVAALLTRVGDLETAYSNKGADAQAAIDSAQAGFDQVTSDANAAAAVIDNLLSPPPAPAPDPTPTPEAAPPIDGTTTEPPAPEQ